MGTDIRSYAEVLRDGQWRVVGDVFPLDEFDRQIVGKDFDCHPFHMRHYGVFGFLAGVRNYSRSDVILKPRGITQEILLSPEVAVKWADWCADAHSASWLTVAELLAWDYDQKFENRRGVRQISANVLDCAAVVDVGDGTIVTYREFLGPLFFRDLDILAGLSPNPADTRIIFWFDE